MGISCAEDGSRDGKDVRMEQGVNDTSDAGVDVLRGGCGDVRKRVAKPLGLM